jgi:hypothetical protein
MASESHVAECLDPAPAFARASAVEHRAVKRHLVPELTLVPIVPEEVTNASP